MLLSFTSPSSFKVAHFPKLAFKRDSKPQVHAGPSGAGVGWPQEQLLVTQNLPVDRSVKGVTLDTKLKG